MKDERRWFSKVDRNHAVSVIQVLALDSESQFHVADGMDYSWESFMEAWNRHHPEEPTITGQGIHLA